jgi:hypothetical protein
MFTRPGTWHLHPSHPTPSRLRRVEDGELPRRLTALELTLLGIGACIGAGIFVLTGAEARIAGPSAPRFATGKTTGGGPRNGWEKVKIHGV